MSMWDDEAGYDRDDPKHPDWADATADRADMARKREKEERDEDDFRTATHGDRSGVLELALRSSAIVVYAEGPVSCSVCAPEILSPEMVATAVNQIAPTGIGSRWTLSEDATFATGDPHPKVCERDPERRHYLFHC